MLDKERDDWCIVRWHDGELVIFREYQWFAQGKYYSHKWEYVAKGMKEKQAKEFEKLFKE